MSVDPGRLADRGPTPQLSLRLTAPLGIPILSEPGSSHSFLTPCSLGSDSLICEITRAIISRDSRTFRGVMRNTFLSPAAKRVSPGRVRLFLGLVVLEKMRGGDVAPT